MSALTERQEELLTAIALHAVEVTQRHHGNRWGRISIPDLLRILDWSLTVDSMGYEVSHLGLVTAHCVWLSGPGPRNETIWIDYDQASRAPLSDRVQAILRLR